ncbi:hypothetical protein M501DRAFT_1011796 [Patellaria atrata CBS 101060]|uniref:Glycine zipper 2TM domain-containing protein n=1 Tax=Patellaria atrata CBS 101060 TaxID=1346257 RepID=A0A9P4VS45_9PEZI|nr:hypothetical protein M501DRAFT_1011796 [Patellaria atrata CBS 101060]
MSDPYNQYPPHQQYGSPAPQGYGQPQYSYDSNQNQQTPYGQQQGYQQQGYPTPHSGYHSPAPPQQGGYQSPAPYGEHGYNQQYGPPAQGGFQHAQQPPQYGPNAQYQQQGQSTSYYDQNYNPTPSGQFPQQGAYNQNPYPSDPNQPQYGATDPNAQAEGDRGLLGAAAGGAAGFFGGNKMGGHGLLGALAGAFAGHKLEEKHKHKKSSHGSHYGSGYH